MDGLRFQILKERMRAGTVEEIVRTTEAETVAIVVGMETPVVEIMAAAAALELLRLHFGIKRPVAHIAAQGSVRGR
jgi:hypothetical protein